MKSIDLIKIIKPDDWHVHLRDDDMLEAVCKYSSRVNHRCIVMPNLELPITTTKQGIIYKKKINLLTDKENFIPLLPCYLIDNLDLKDFKYGLQSQIFVGAKFYPSNATTNSSFGISNIEEIFPALEILASLSKPLLVHGEKVRDDIDIFDREKYFIDEDLNLIIDNFPELKVVLEHVSSKYGADYVDENKNIAGTITPQHMILTKEDVFYKDSLDPHHFCMPVVKEQSDLIALRNYATSGNPKFFIGTDSAPHHVNFKIPNFSAKPGIFSAPSSIELYTTIFDQENKLHNLEKFSSINGANFYEMEVNLSTIELIREKWHIPEYTSFKEIKIKNFMGGKEINWKVKE